MKRLHFTIGLCAILGLCACDHNDFPSWPSETKIKLDTIDCSCYDIPSEAITVHKALKIGQKLAEGKTTSEYYYIKGLVTRVDSLSNGKAYFAIQDNDHSNDAFLCFGIGSINEGQFTGLNQIVKGDFVAVYTQITNFYGKMETPFRGSARLIFSTNSLVYPISWVSYFEDSLRTVDNWISEVKSGAPSFAIWQQYTTSGNTPGVKATAVNGVDTAVAEVWFISKGLNLISAKAENPVFTFAAYYRDGTCDEQAIRQYLKLKVRKNGQAWQDVDIPTMQRNTGRQNPTAQDTVSISNFISDNTQVAFVYTSTKTVAPEWVIRNISVGEQKRKTPKNKCDIN